MRGAGKPHLEAIQGNKQPQDVVGALEDAEDPQIPHHPLHSRVLQTRGDLTVGNGNNPQQQRLFSAT